MLFGRKAKTRMTVQEALAAKPVRLVDPQITPTPDGGAKLKVELTCGRASRWMLLMPARTSKTFELDAIGLLVWNSCDGKTSVQQIIRKLSKAYSLNSREAAMPTQKFLQMLMRKGLVGIAVKKED